MCGVAVILWLQGAQYCGRYTRCQHTCGQIPSDDAACGDNGAGAYGDTGHHHHPGAKPDILLQHNGPHLFIAIRFAKGAIAGVDRMPRVARQKGTPCNPDVIPSTILLPTARVVCQPIPTLRPITSFGVWLDARPLMVMAALRRQSAPISMVTGPLI